MNRPASAAAAAIGWASLTVVALLTVVVVLADGKIRTEVAGPTLDAVQAAMRPTSPTQAAMRPTKPLTPTRPTSPMNPTRPDA